MFSSDDLYLRRIEGRDIPVVLDWENDRENWKVSDRSEPLSLLDIQALVISQEAPVFGLDQIRYMIIETKTNKPIGTVDLYEIDWKSDAALIGILIADKSKRRMGAAFVALQLLGEIALQQLELEKLCARVHKTNSASQKLFEKALFKKKSEELDQQNSVAKYIDCDIFEIWLSE